MSTRDPATRTGFQTASRYGTLHAEPSEPGQDGSEPEFKIELTGGCQVPIERVDGAAEVAGMNPADQLVKGQRGGVVIFREVQKLAESAGRPDAVVADFPIPEPVTAAADDSVKAVGGIARRCVG